MLPGAESSGDRKAGRYGKLAGKTSTAGAQLLKTHRSVRIITKNELAEIFFIGQDPVKELSCHPGYGQAERRKLGPARR